MGDPNSDGGRRGARYPKATRQHSSCTPVQYLGNAPQMATPNRCSAGTKTNRNFVPWMVSARRLFGVLIKTVNCGCVTIRCSSMAEECEMRASLPAKIVREWCGKRRQVLKNQQSNIISRFVLGTFIGLLSAGRSGERRPVRG